MGNANNLRSALTPTDRVRFVLRRHPLLCFFLLALGLSWVYELPVFRFLHLPFLPWSLSAPIIGPTLAAFLMTLVTEGRAGVLRLLRRCVSWRVGVQWYLFALLGIFAIVLLSFLSARRGNGGGI
jgi:dolichol kinase